MATIERTVELIFAGADQISPIIKDISGSFDTLEAGINAVVDPLAKIGKGVLAADAALIGLAAGGLTVAFNKALDFEGASVELAKVLGDEENRLQEVQDAALELSNTYGISSVAILSNVAAIKQAGFDVDDSLRIQKAALDLVIAGDLDAAQATELLISTLKGFKAPAEEVGRIVDILNEVSNRYATNVEELAIGMAKLSPIAGTVGLSFEETAAILTPIIEVFRSGDEAATALKTGLARLVDDNPTIVAALKRLEVAQKDLNTGALRPAGDILLDVAAAFNTANDADKLFLASQLVGINQAARLVAVFDNQAKVTDIVAVALDSAGSASKEVALRMQTAELAVERFKVGFENLAIVVGLTFKDAAASAFNGATDIENALQNLVKSGAFNQLAEELRKLFINIGQFLTDIAKALPDAFKSVKFDPIIDALESFGDAFADILGGLDLTKPEDLGKALQATVETIASLIAATQGMAQAFRPIVDAILIAIEDFNKLSEKDKIEIGQNILGTAILIKEAGISIGLSIAAIAATGADVRNVFDVVTSAIEAAWETLKSGVLLAELLIVGSIQTLVSSINFANQNLPKGLQIDWIDDLDRSLTTLRGVIEDQLVASTVEANAELFNFQQALQGSSTRADDTGKIIVDTSTKMTAMKQSTADAATEIKKLEDNFISAEDPLFRFKLGVENLDDDFVGMNAEISTAGIEFGKLGGSLDVAASKFKNTGTQADASRIHIENLGEETGNAGNKFGDLIQNAEGVWTNLGTVADTVPDVTAGMVSLRRDTEATGSKLQGAEKDTEDFRLALARIQADLTTKKYEMIVDIQTAQIQADARIVEATLDALSTTIDSTGDAITTLFQLLSDALGQGQTALANQIQAQIAREQFRREQAFNMEMAVMQANLDSIIQRNQILQQGGALIQIDSTGLEPALEQVMWSILEKVQLRVNASAADFLIGIP